MKLIFNTERHISSYLLRFFMMSNFSHCAIEYCGYVIEARGSTGVQIIELSEFKKRSYKYEEYDLGIDVYTANKVWDFLKNQVGKKYDYSAVFSMLFRKTPWQDDNKWFCSELCAKALVNAGVLKFPILLTKVIPRDLLLMIYNKTKG